LGLVGELSYEWERYIQCLIDAGIATLENQDELRWIGGDCTVIITTKNVYNALAAKL